MRLIRPMSAAAAAWQAWRAGDFFGARAHAEELLTHGVAVDEARHILTLVAHVQGDHAAALAAYDGIGKHYRRLPELDEPVLWSHLRLGDLTGAHAFAALRGLLRSDAVVEQLRLALEKPLSVDVNGIDEVPFTGDAFSPLMPGVGVRLNGRPVVARLDTGGSFLHVTRRQAQALDIPYAGCERAFAGLTTGAVCYGVADLEIGGARLRNVPVHVHADNVLPIDVIANAFQAEVGVLIGTNALACFLTTIDAPAGRLILSRRGDDAARSEHLSRVQGPAHQVPFGLLGSHLMIANGRMGSRPLNFFIDSGLAVFNHEQGQAAMLLPRRTLGSWHMRRPPADRFAPLDEAVALGSAEQRGLTAFVVADRTWRQFGDWSGIEVTALLSHAYFKHYAWTLDFDRQVHLLHEPASDGP